MQELYHRLLRDIKALGVPVDFTFELKPYSKTYFGRYDPNTNKVTVYVYKDVDCTSMYDYRDILLTTIHEAVHCMQWHGKSFVRRKGIMHDTEFYSLFNMYSDKAKAHLLLREVRYDSPFTPFRGTASTVYCQYS